MKEIKCFIFYFACFALLVFTWLFLAKQTDKYIFIVGIPSAQSAKFLFSLKKDEFSKVQVFL